MAQYKITNDPYSVDFSLTNGNGLVRRTVQNAKFHTTDTGDLTTDFLTCRRRNLTRHFCPNLTA